MESICCQSISLKLVNGSCDIDLIRNILPNYSFKTVDLYVETSSLSSDYDLINNMRKKWHDYGFVFQISQTESAHNINGKYMIHKYGNFYESVDRKFYISFDHFHEAKLYNTFFNKKIFVDKHFALKLNPLDDFTLGDVFSNIFKLRKPESSWIWNINKDKVIICKDCEFRYMCLDDRIPSKRGDGLFYYKQKCIYDPLLKY